MSGFTVPGMTDANSREVTELLQRLLSAYNDLHLTLKHVHWNVVGPHFIAVHEMIDPHVDEVIAMVDETAERIATLGGEPLGTPGSIVARRTWDDYDLNRADVQSHLGALDLVYAGLIEDHGKGIEATEESDPVTQDMLIAQTAELEQFHWFVRAHLEDSSGRLSTEGATTERGAADQAAKAAGRKNGNKAGEVRGKGASTAARATAKRK